MLAVESKIAAGNGRTPHPETAAAWKQIVEPVEPFLEAVAARLSDMARHFQARGRQVVFAVPPLAGSETELPERHGLRALFSEVARRCQCEVWNFASLDLLPSSFRDVTHLNQRGRAEFSAALAREIARMLGAR